MNVVPVLLLCSLVLAAGSILLFVFSARQGDCHEAERMCLLPLEDDTVAASEPARTTISSPESDSCSEESNDN